MSKWEQLEINFEIRPSRKDPSKMTEDEFNKIYAPHKLAAKARAQIKSVCDEVIAKGFIQKWEVGSMLQGLAYEYRVGTVYTEKFAYLNVDPNQKAKPK